MNKMHVGVCVNEIRNNKQLPGNIQPLCIFPLTGKDIPDDGSGRFPTLVLKKPSQPEKTTQVCTSEMLCAPDTGKSMSAQSTVDSKSHCYLHVGC